MTPPFSPFVIFIRWFPFLPLCKVGINRKVGIKLKWGNAMLWLPSKKLAYHSPLWVAHLDTRGLRLFDVFIAMFSSILKDISSLLFHPPRILVANCGDRLEVDSHHFRTLSHLFFTAISLTFYAVNDNISG